MTQDQSATVGLLGVVTGQDVEPDPDRPAGSQEPDNIDSRPPSPARSQNPDPQTGRVQGSHSHRTRKRPRHCCGSHSRQHPRRRHRHRSCRRRTARHPHRGRFGVRVRCGSRNVRQQRPYRGCQTHRAQTPHQTRLPPRRLRHRHRSPDSNLPRPPHHPHTSGGSAPFAKRCNGCPLRGRCTTSKRGRTITIDRYHNQRAANKTRWAQDETQHTYRTYRPSVERTIAWLTRHNPRRVPYRGTIRNQQWLTTPTAAINLQRLINLGLDHGPTGWVLNPA